MRSANHAQMGRFDFGRGIFGDFLGEVFSEKTRCLKVVAGEADDGELFGEEIVGGEGLQSAGMRLAPWSSRRWRRKMTMTQGRRLRSWCFCVIHVQDFFSAWAAELEKRMADKILEAKVAFAARQETLVERFRKHRSGEHRTSMPGENGPAALRRNRKNAAGRKTLEERLLEKRDGREGRGAREATTLPRRQTSVTSARLKSYW